MSFMLTVLAIALAAVSGVPGLFMPRRSAWGQTTAVSMVCLAALCGLSGVVLAWTQPDPELYVLSWLSALNPKLGLDALSAFFLVPVYLIGACGSIYGLRYWPAGEKGRTAPRLQIFWGLLMAGMAWLLISRDAMAFLLGWETMALSAFFLITAEDDRQESRKSGLVYLIATHIGTLCLFCLFALWRYASGSFDFLPLQAGTVSTLVLNALFFLALIGFGMKAGVIPLHFWLPGAHANAPSHVSAILSGVMLKMGVYGLVRLLSLLPEPPPLWGWLILILGAVSGLLGVVFALAQHDLKRLLAYCSVENIGIILMGLGLAMLGRSMDRPELVLLGMAGCLLHVWSHSLFKALLFMGAGSVLHETRTRNIDQLGGLSRRMPWSAGLFLIGAVAICGLPPLNGFVSELFVYLGLFKAWALPGSASLAMVAAPVLAMIGALAVACFVKAYGTVFLGAPRSPACERAREVPWVMIVPMGFLALLCLIIGFAPGLVVAVLSQAVSVWLPLGPSRQTGADLAASTPLSAVSFMALGLVGLVAVLAFLLHVSGKKRSRTVTWDCGYARPDSRMQYTASSLVQSLVGLFGWVLGPKTHGRRVQGYFPRQVTWESRVDEPVLDRVLAPRFGMVRDRLNWFHRFQQGKIQNYIFYILVTLLAMLATLVPFRKLLAGFFVDR